ncbi:branched-chain amino acid aminotransferase [Neobacillus drentensis]|uniref:branched-chain amino acid aminotransferase n=1 Tax=Neobacillus drentensis TaxID=220684 RepID=UPI001F31D45B|nr:branched-chain amino acid aminotransferase [Neobacillus drentensis]ULT54729.1 branched-chain amino acid aminotransferase [Neobacillus drentensis]
MLKEKIKQYIAENDRQSTEGGVVLFKEEIEYAEQNQLTGEGEWVEKDANTRFADAYIERCDKESENMLKNETSAFLSEPLHYLKKHKNEFIYLESKWFDFVNVDAISLEVDDVFGTFDVMLGLKVQKKYDKQLREYLNAHLNGEDAKFDLMFTLDDGLWNLNFVLNYVEGFDEEMTMGEAFQLIYHFLFKLVEAVEKAQ